MIPLRLALVGALALPGSAFAEERTVVEQRLAEQNLCAGLETEQFGQTIGITELEDVELREADLSLRGEDVELRFVGRLSCRSPQGGLLTGNASAAISGEATLSLATCTVDTFDVELSDFQGTFGPILSSFAPQIQEALANEARPLLADACRQLRGE